MLLVRRLKTTCTLSVYILCSTISVKSINHLGYPPEMSAGITDYVWELTDIVNLIPVEEPKKRGAYKKYLVIND